MTNRVISLGYIKLLSPEISAWREFGVDVLGLMLNENQSNEDTLVFRMDDHPSRLVIEKHDQNTLGTIGWELQDEAAWLACIDALKAAGCEVQVGDETGAAVRNVKAFAMSADPAGNPFEIFHTRTGLANDFESPTGVRFVTGDMGMGHGVLPAPNTDEVHNFYRDVLGFGDSDNLVLPPPAEGAPQMNVRFMHAANPRHHSLALFNFPHPLGLVHLILEVQSMDEVGACLDRVEQAGYPLMATLGRHCNDQMVSFYVFSPGGFAVEYGYDGLQIDWQNFVPTESTQGDIWGHQYVTPEV